MPKRKRKPLPKIGPRQAGELRLSPKLKGRLKKRATAEARAKARPQIRALKKTRKIYQKQKSAANREYQGSLRAAQGAVAFGQKYIGKTSLKGLKGKVKQDVAREIAGTQKDIAASYPMWAQEARQTRSEEMAGIREDKAALAQDIAEARADMMADAADNFAIARRGAVEEAQTAIKRQRAEKREKKEDKKEKSKEKSKSQKQADQVAKNLWNQLNPKGQAKLLAGDKATIAEVASRVLSSEGVEDMKTARKAVAKLRSTLTGSSKNKELGTKWHAREEARRRKVTR
jgi:hypothetical protein